MKERTPRKRPLAPPQTHRSLQPLSWHPLRRGCLNWHKWRFALRELLWSGTVCLFLVRCPPPPLKCPRCSRNHDRSTAFWPTAPTHTHLFLCGRLVGRRHWCAIGLCRPGHRCIPRAGARIEGSPLSCCTTAKTHCQHPELCPSKLVMYAAPVRSCRGVPVKPLVGRKQQPEVMPLHMSYMAHTPWCCIQEQDI